MKTHNYLAATFDHTVRALGDVATDLEKKLGRRLKVQIIGISLTQTVVLGPSAEVMKLIGAVPESDDDTLVKVVRWQGTKLWWVKAGLFKAKIPAPSQEAATLQIMAAGF